MPAPHITLTFDYPRTELKREGWGVTKVSGSFDYAAWTNDPWHLSGGSGYRKGRPSENVSLIGDPKVLRLRANFEDPAFSEAAAYAADFFGLSDLVVGDSGQFMELPGRRGILSKRNAAADEIAETFSVTSMLKKLVDLILANQLVWAWATATDLQANEGFGMRINPSGTGMDSVSAYAAVAWGGRFYLQINMNGTADFWDNQGTDADPQWVWLDTFNFGKAGLSHRQPMTVAVIPWGLSYIDFVFRNATGVFSFANTRSRMTSGFGQSFTYDLKRIGFVPTIDETLQAVVKTAAAPAFWAMQKSGGQYQILPYKVRYPASETVYMAPQEMERVREYEDPTVKWTGFADFDGTHPTQPQIVSSVIDSDGTPWDKTQDHQPTAKFVLSSSADRVYSPELWSYEMRVKSEVYMPDWTPFDASAQWYYIRLQRKAAAEAAQCSIKLFRDGDLANLYKRGSPVRIQAKGADETKNYTIFDGYMIDRKPTVKGHLLLIEDEVECLDMWDRLNTTPITQVISIDGKTVGDVLEDLLNQAGFFDTEVQIYSEVGDIPIEGFSEPNALKVFSLDSMVGDAIRELIKRYGIQGRSDIRVRWIEDSLGNSFWRAYFDPVYDPASPPNIIFYLDSTLAPDMSDVERWIGDGTFNYYLVNSAPEWTINQPEFTALKCVGSTGTGEGSEGLVAFIPPDPAVTDDPASALFEGRIRCKTIGPPEIVAQTQDALDREARRIYDRAQEGLVLLSFEGEWQPGLDVDMWVAVIGRNEAGAQVSYGAYRIQCIDAEIRQDHAIDGSNTSRWEWAANYSLVYVGPAEYEGIPMFSEVLPL
jgi:hypothetical protein